MITFEGTTYEPAAGESVLDCLSRHGVSVPSFCQSGVCQTCLMRAVDGDVPARAQQGLKESWKKRGFFLTCICSADRPLTLEGGQAAERFSSRIQNVRSLSPRVSVVHLERPSDFQFEAGQFVQVIRAEDDVRRPYSIASLPSEDHIELHVAVFPGGELSPWLSSSIGAKVELEGPFGECVYVPIEPDRPLVLAGTGTGLAPLVGVFRAALEGGHQGPITLYHGARNASDLYFSDELRALPMSSQHRIIELLLEGEESEATDEELFRRRIGDLVDVVLEEQAVPRAARFYLCGAPELVHRLKKKLYLKGASLDKIHADPFLSRATPAGAA